MTGIAALKAANARRWVNMHIRADRIPAFDATARRLSDPVSKARHAGVTARLVAVGYQPVPWWFIDVVSECEYGGPSRWVIVSWGRAIRCTRRRTTSRVAAGHSRIIPAMLREAMMPGPAEQRLLLAAGGVPRSVKWNLVASSAVRRNKGFAILHD